MAKLIDLTGKRYAKLTVVSREDNSPRGVAVWLCRCDCGNFVSVRGGNLKSGAVKSCGCLRKTPPNKSHGMSHSALYRKWAAIKRRCYCKSVRSYKDYGARGIKMCEEWERSSSAFIKWALENGYEEGLTIERINNDGDYCPGNCKWIPFTEQQGNRRNCVKIEYNGKTKNLSQWCRDLGLDYSRVHNRMKKLGWTFEKAISEPVDIKKRAGKKGD